MASALKPALRVPLQAPALSQPFLLELPGDLLAEVLRRAPRSCRATCHTFRQQWDAGCSALRLHWPADMGAAAPSDHSALLSRSPQLRHLDCSRAPVPCSTLFAHCPALTALDLSYSHWQTDLTLLSTLPSLTTLNLAGSLTLTDLGDLAGLSGASGLTCLDLSGAQVLHNIAAVSAIASLTHLDLTACYSVTDMSVLGACPRLASLALSAFEAAGGTNAAVLTQLAPLLDALSLTCWSDVSLQPLTLLTALRTLSVNFRHLNHLGSVALCWITALHLTWVTATNLQPLSQCRHLATLYLTRCHNLCNLRPLAGCPALSTLYLGVCDHVSNLGHPTSCRSLTELCCCRCNLITALEPLSQCPALQVLRFSSCPGIMRLHTVQSCPSLTLLDLRRCSGASVLHVSILARELWVGPPPWRQRKLGPLVVRVEGKPAAAPLNVRWMMVLTAVVPDLFLFLFVSWYLGWQLCTLVLSLLFVLATTVFAVF